MALSNAEIEAMIEAAVSKAFFGTPDLADGGLLNPEQSDTFIDTVIDASVVLPQVRTIRMTAPERLVEKLGFGQRILQASPGEGEEITDATKPATGKVRLQTREYVAAVDISYDALEDNIERANLEDHIMRLASERVGLDSEEVGLLSGLPGFGTDVFAVQPGWLALADQHDITVTGPFDEHAVFGALLEAVPGRYFRNPADWRFFVSTRVELRVRRQRAERQTAGGDAWLSGRAPMEYAGIPIQPVGVLDDNWVFLAHPQNLLYGVQRNIFVETQRRPRRRMVELTITLRIAFGVETPDAAAKATGYTL